MPADDYDVKSFMADARRVLDAGRELPDVKAEIGDRLSHLSRRDDLTRRGRQVGSTDASSGGYLLWREPPYFTLVLVKFDEHYRSPIHEHGDHWVVAAGYRGTDRWDVYERVDGRDEAGSALIELRDQVVVSPGVSTSLSAPPRSIHSHNNLYRGDTLELIFSAVTPVPAERRFLYDLSDSTATPSWFEVSEQLQGDYFPPRPSTPIDQ